MKKAKIFLTALSVLAVVGGAVAFRAKSATTFAYCNTNKPIPVCESLPFQSFATTAAGDLPAEFDELGKPCKIRDGVYTCFTSTTISL